MNSAEAEIIYSDDYTRIAQHDSKSWTAKDISFAGIGGVSWIAARSAARRTALVWFPAMVLPLALVLLLIGWSPFLALFALPFLFLVLYRRASGERKGGLNEPQRRALRTNFRGQPTHLLGLGRDRDPDRFDWQVILFRFTETGKPTHQ